MRFKLQINGSLSDVETYVKVLYLMFIDLVATDLPSIFCMTNSEMDYYPVISIYIMPLHNTNKSGAMTR